MKKAVFVLLFLALSTAFPANIKAACCVGRSCGTPLPAAFCAGSGGMYCDVAAECPVPGTDPDRVDGAGACQDIEDPNLMATCYECAQQGVGYVWTALGCFNAGDPKAGVGQILGWAVVVGFGIAFLMSIFAGFQIITASGDPKRLKAAQELLTAAISGLLLIIFSVFLLNLIGFSILRLPGFNI